ncbi:hypothetical protein EST38_g8494 [Candolleomyces aberdarensis]|uniref:Uncharacterized protein n=1 Tax=Candolleomyces aberdarensis TaxID=2316362 RepID=A0A4Q2DCB5_9AGAR|nr:hypothetical protein EST38_g8494 [Candolleomyces aberdarensis]
MSTAAAATVASLPTPTTRRGEGKSNGSAQSTASTFSFKTPAPPPATAATSLPAPLKQRRVSLALPSSPRVVEGWSFRDDTGLDKDKSAGGVSGHGAPETSGARASGDAPLPERVRKVESPSESHQPLLPGPSSTTPERLVSEKKARKKWTPEETQMLVTGCNKHGVGNWKTILRDPTLKFDSRSPVDLKDRFRTYFPDAYKQHYPNAKTHLSSKVRSTLPDGSSLFEKTRSKRRRPFTEEEDRALKEGYEKYGTVWATIVKDYPIFQEQNRRSTDLRDRFRNAFPELYQLAGYKPRNSAKKKMAAAAAAADAASTASAATMAMNLNANLTMSKRAATDDQLGTTSTGGPVRSRRRAHTNQGLLRGGTKSVPQSTACTEDEDSSGGEDEGQMSPPFNLPSTPLISDVVGDASPSKNSPNEIPCETDEDDSMDMITLDPLADALALPADFMPPTQEGHSQHAWSSGVSTPTHSNHWSTAAGSPTSSHLSSSDLLMGSSSSPFLSQQRRSDSHNTNNGHNTFSVGGMIGKSAWGTDWFSPNPRLDPSSSGAGAGANANASSSSSAFMHEHSSPASPFSFHQLNQGVMDRYDLLPTTSSMINDFSSEVGVGDTHSTFSDDVVFQHHPGGARTHQPVHNGGFFTSGGLGAAAGGGAGGFGFGSLGLTGLSLSAMTAQNAGIHPMQLHTPSIYATAGGLDDPTGIGGLALDDPHTGPGAGGSGGGGGGAADPLGITLPPESMDEDLREDDVAMGDVSGSSHSHHASPTRQAQQSGQSSPSKRPEQQQQQQFLHHHHHHHHHHNHHAALQEQQRKDAEKSKAALMAAEPFSLDDLVDLSNELHTTPPATPLTHPRPIRSANSSGSNGGIGIGTGAQGSSTSSLHARSVSVPPSEFRNSVVIQNTSISALIDYDYDEGQLQLQQRGLASFLGGGGGAGGVGQQDLSSLSAALGVVRQLNLFPPSISQQLSQGEQQQQQQQQQMVDAGRVGRGTQRDAYTGQFEAPDVPAHKSCHTTLDSPFFIIQLCVFASVAPTAEAATAVGDFGVSEPTIVGVV